MLLLWLLMRNNQIEENSDKGRESDAAHGDMTEIQLGTTDAEGQDERYNDKVAGITHIDLILYKRIYSYRCDSADKQRYKNSCSEGYK